MPAYDSTLFDPPAPLALVAVKSAEAGIVIRDVPMLIDTGADVSLLPLSYFEHLVLPGAKQYELEAFNGKKSTTPSVSVELLFLGKTFRGQFLLVESPYGILGRNVLNSVSLLFNGPDKCWSEQH